jgi:hypothetical protein
MSTYVYHTGIIKTSCYIITYTGSHGTWIMLLLIVFETDSLTCIAWCCRILDMCADHVSATSRWSQCNVPGCSSCDTCLGSINICCPVKLYVSRFYLNCFDYYLTQPSYIWGICVVASYVCLSTGVPGFICSPSSELLMKRPVHCYLFNGLRRTY